jgi:ubiquinone/menaquinone biosynthesis C-methylase UbiE
LTNLRFEEGDACDLSGVADESFDLVVSMFGAMFAPRPFDAAAEMVRVTRRGGRTMMGNWIPGDPTLVAQILKISAAYTPAPRRGSSARLRGAWRITSGSASARPALRRITSLASGRPTFFAIPDRRRSSYPSAGGRLAAGVNERS